jgi:hypothetical protein
MYCSHRWITATCHKWTQFPFEIKPQWVTKWNNMHYLCWELVIYFHWDTALAHNTQNSVWTIITHSWRHKLTVKHYCSGSLDWNVYNFYFWQNLKQKLTDGNELFVGFRDWNPPKGEFKHITEYYGVKVHSFNATNFREEVLWTTTTTHRYNFQLLNIA